MDKRAESEEADRKRRAEDKTAVQRQSNAGKARLEMSINAVMSTVTCNSGSCPVRLGKLWHVDLMHTRQQMPQAEPISVCHRHLYQRP